MKLIIQIPAYNEAATLGLALAELPRQVPGFDKVEWLLIDDGSTDDTVEIAKKCNVDHIVRHATNRGLAAAFRTGIENCLVLGADVIVNTDADNQYCAADIPELVKPIQEGRADMVVGARPIQDIEHFSGLKKFFQRFGSYIVRIASGTSIADAPSGFRAVNRVGASKIAVYNKYTYTLETIIQAGRTGLKIISVPIRVNEDLRPSRLVKSIPSYIAKSVSTIFNVFILYRPFSFFFWLGVLFLVPAFLLGLRFLYFYLNDGGAGHIQSLIFASLLGTAGGGCWMLAVISKIIAANRILLEDIRSRLLLHGFDNLSERELLNLKNEKTGQTNHNPLSTSKGTAQ